MSTWSFITNHGAVLSLVSRYNQITAREIAAQLGITERSVLRIISDLEAEGYLERTRDGRVNYYEVNHELPLRRPELRDTAVGELLNLLRSPPSPEEEQQEEEEEHSEATGT
jgi:DNA-binding transcriptional ArsR family regulator